MDDGVRWVVVLVAIVALVALIVFARGEPDHGHLADIDPTPVGVMAG
jgi:hypothetical protein